MYSDGMVFNVDQNPKFAGLTSHKKNGIVPCIRPHGLYFIYDRMALMSAQEMAAAQGWSLKELERAVGNNVTNRRFVSDLVGNGFSTTTFAATLLVALMSWTRC